MGLDRDPSAVFGDHLPRLVLRLRPIKISGSDLSFLTQNSMAENIQIYLAVWRILHPAR
jgi:hypothetical protein